MAAKVNLCLGHQIIMYLNSQFADFDFDYDD